MVTTLKHGSEKDSLSKLLARIEKESGRGINTTKYSGVIKLKVDPLFFQKQLRDEWE